MRLVKNEMYIDKGVMSQKLTGHSGMAANCKKFYEQI